VPRIELSEREFARLRARGELAGATVLRQEDSRRRRLSASLAVSFEMRIAAIARFQEAFATFEVPRSGPHADLGRWLSKLRETYTSGSDAERCKMVQARLPALHEHLLAWARRRKTRRPLHAPAWLQAAWAMDFMSMMLRAPSQASPIAAEIACAKWITKWAPVRLVGPQDWAAEQQLGVAVFNLASELRRPETALAARAAVAVWHEGPVFELIVRLAKAPGEGPLTAGQLQRIAAREAFWPSRTQWEHKHRASVDEQGES